ncbi:RHS repeat domain-containing protein [Streptomyces sp. bgisy034]|uniref:RHS repeat domain-containing protein n=1 Tax=Streptomyces sp. bgisy034 TaxID=3413774 RepID=UPI003EBB409F
MGGEARDGRRLWGRGVRSTATVLVGLMVTGLLGGPVAAAAELRLRDVPEQQPVPTGKVTAKKLSWPDETVGRNVPAKHTVWPKPGTAEAGLPAKGGKGTRMKAGSLPVALTAAGGTGRAGLRTAQVQLLDRSVAEKAGVDGVVLAVRGFGKGRGKTGLTVDYSGFKEIYGGSWASRLTLRELPDCALTTPGTKGCSPGKELEVRNDLARGELSAEVTLDATAAQGPQQAADMPVASNAPLSDSATAMSVSQGAMLLAVTASVSGSSGTFAATSLAPSGSWEAGGSSGGFSWTQPFELPSVPGALQPELGLAYSSQSVDGRTAATNNQAAWAGDGWSLAPGSIERRYVPCEDDKKDGNNPSTRVGDQCWKKHNATLSLGGSSSELVRDDATGTWRKKNDDGTRIDLLTSSNRGNGDNNGEYWRVTAPDGTRYYFGYHRLPGWTDGKEVTNSTWTVPVFGNHAGEPCHAASFADSWCQQAWRWNLDYVVDPHGNAMAYYWNRETNYYGRNTSESTNKGTPTAYHRGGYLKRIEYGLRSNTMYAQKSAAKTEFTVAERCLPSETFDCAADKFTEANASKWPDVPFDQYCKSGETCEGNASPSFWTRKRLTEITSYALTDGAYQKVDSWKLEHSFPSTGDGTDKALWLKSITRTGHTGASPITLPAVTFRGVQMANRVSGAVDELPSYNRYRVYAIDTETGGTIGVTYSAHDCTPSTLPSPATNTKRCYPVVWSPPDAPAADYEPYQDWFHSYAVAQLLETDTTGGAPTKQTSYSYLGGLAWAKSEDEFTKAEHRTYGDRRGYERVKVTTGTTDDVRTQTETRYFRGIDGTAVADSTGATVTDHKHFAGMAREQITYTGVGGSVLSAVSYTPWRSAVHATHSREGLPTLEARATGVQREATRTVVSGGAERKTELTRGFDSYGMTASTSDAGDVAVTGDERCVTTTYNRNTDKNILETVAETKTVAKPCGTTPSLPTDLISANRAYYDGATALDTAPVKGDVTRKDENDGAGTGFITVSTTTYDQYGRQLTATDAKGGKTTVAYTPATGQSPQQTLTTNAVGHTHTVYTDPRRGSTTATTDANGKRTDASYDAFGRLTQVWEPGWAKADHPTQPSASYSYRISKTEPNLVTTKTLQYDGSYATSHRFLDGLLRERETQVVAIGDPDGRVVTETLYNTLGQVTKTYGSYYASGKPANTLVTGDDTKVPAATWTKYDGAGRATAQIALKYGDEQSRTTTQYGGDRTTVMPPAGGTATTTVTDALGRVTDRISYTNAARTESVSAAYAYNKRGERVKLTDADGNVWTWTYDARGREIKADDPDKGVSTTTYDELDRPVSTTDARGVVLTTVYDALGRPTALKQGATLRAEWIYDTLAKGQPTSSTRYDGGAAYTSAVGGYTDRYQPTSASVTIPSAEGALADTYTWSYGFNAYTGQQEWVMQPSLGGVPGERVTTVYGEGNLPVRTTAGRILLAGATVYDTLARPIRTEYGTLGQKVYETRDYDEHTGALTRHTIDGDVALRVQDTRYRYDKAGNLTRVAAVSGQDAQASADTQCFATDALRRLTDAWTTKDAADDCSAGPTAAAVGGPDAYWHSYSYDITGNRTKEVRHATAAGGTDVTRDYTYGRSGDDAPHALRAITTTGGAADGTTETFGYDEAGNTVSRSGGARAQSLAWDAEGRLAKVTEDGKETSYLYTAGGDRLLARNADGSTTVYLPDGNELTATGSTVKGTRYYSHGGQTIAMRTSAGITYLFPDHQGTSLVAVSWGATQTVTRRKQMPFGGVRQAASSWPGDRGFLGATSDPTGTTHLGAREYDPELGRFLSVDPLLVEDDLRQHNPYIYGNNNPATFTDPTGTILAECWTGEIKCSGGKPVTTSSSGLPGSNNCYTGNMSASCSWANPDHNSPEGKRRSRELAAAIDAPKYCYGGSQSASCFGNGSSPAKQQAGAEKRRAEIERAIEQQKQNGQDNGFWSKLGRGDFKGAASSAGNWLKDTFTTWDGWKNGVLPALAFGACVVLSVGGCVIVGAAAATAILIGDKATTGKWEWSAWGKSLAWGAFGGAAAFKFARWGGAIANNALWGSAVARTPVRVRPATTTSGAIWKDGPVDWAATRSNMAVNSGFNFGFCGAGSESVGSQFASC